MSQAKHNLHMVENNGTLSDKGAALKVAAGDLAHSLTDVAREKFQAAGSATNTYVRNHPGRFILGACCVGLAAGWLLHRGKRS